MGFRKKAARRLLQLNYVKHAMAQPSLPLEFRRRPTPMQMLGISLFLISYVIGWPLVGLFSAFMVYIDKPLYIPIGGPLIYGFSHIVWIASMIIMGKEYGEVIMRWATMKGVKWLSGQGENGSTDESAGPESSSDNLSE